MMFGRWRRRLRYWRSRDQRARLLRDEIQAHLDMKADEYIAGGMPEAEARAAARRGFGNATLLEEDARTIWIARWLSDAIQDTVFGLRTLRKEPGFAVVATLSAALGIGACSLLFGVANFAVFRPLPVADSGNLLSVSGRGLHSGKIGTSLSYPDIQDLERAPSLESFASFFPFVPATLSGGGEPRRQWGSLVTANYFDVVKPAFALGRGFDAARDDRPGESPSVVLSHALWRSQFGADPAIVGRTIEINRRKATVLGVTAAAFRGTESMFHSDFWLPFSMLDEYKDQGFSAARLAARDNQWLLGVARLRPGAQATQAAAEIEVIAQRLRTAYKATNEHRAYHVERAGQVNPGFRKMAGLLFLMLSAVSALLLGTASANIANLLLARAAARRLEIDTRLAIGAGRGRLIRQLLTESVLLALAGGIGGYAVALAGVAALASSRIPLSMPVDLAISLDYRVMLFATLLSALTGIVFGLLPALRATRARIAPHRSPRRFGLQNLLVVAQVAVCAVLLIGSGLFVRSLGFARTIDTGMANRNVVMASFDPSLNHYSKQETARLMDSLIAGARNTPGVQFAALTNSVPLSLEGTQNGFEPDNGKHQLMMADLYAISPGFFETLGIPLLDGADFLPGTADGDAAIVNQELAKRAFENQSPVGKYINYFGRRVRIIGMTATAKSRTIGEDPHPCLYLPLARELRGNDSLTGMTLLLGTRGNPAGHAPAIRELIRKQDPALAVFNVETMATQITKALFLPRVAASLFGIAGLAGLLLSITGVYGVINFGVVRRTREIGVRVALGARREQVVRMVLGQGALLAGLGVVAGLAAGIALARLAASLLYGIGPYDLATFIGVPLLLLAVALAACLVPARRAASVDPIRALHYE